jgi:chaperone modulatory protein CbpM
MTQKPVSSSALTSEFQLTVYDLDELAARCGVDVSFIQQLVELGVIDTHPDSPTPFAHQLRFTCDVTLRVGKVVRLQQDLGVNQEGAAVILELLDQIDALERQLAGLKRH